MSDKANPWIQELDTDLQNEVTSDIHPINSQVDIQPTAGFFPAGAVSSGSVM